MIKGTNDIINITNIKCRHQEIIVNVKGVDYCCIIYSFDANLLENSILDDCGFI